MNESQRFVEWLLSRLETELSALSLEQAFDMLDRVERVLRVGGMVFGAVVDSHLEVLRDEVKPTVDARRKVVQAALTMQLLDAGEVAARALVRSVGAAFVPLLEHPEARVRLLVAPGIPHEARRPLEARLAREDDVRVAAALVQRLAGFQERDSAAVLEAVGHRFPVLQLTVLQGVMHAAPERLNELALAPATRLDTVRALSHEAARRLSARDSILLGALDDASPAVRAAGLEGVRHWGLQAARDAVTRLAELREPQALRTLVLLDAQRAFPLVVANIQAAGEKRLEGVLELLAARHLTRAHRETLLSLESLLPEGRERSALARVRHRRHVSAVPQSGPWEALEAQVRAEPSRSESWQVLSDALQSANDPRGELIALSLAGRPAREKLLDALQVQAPELMALLDSDVLGSLTLEHGLPSGMTLHRLDDDQATQAQIVAALLRSPMGRFVRSLELGPASDTEETDWSPVLEMLVAAGTRLETLKLINRERDLPWGDVSAAWEVVGLRHFELEGVGSALGHAVSPTLRTLKVTPDFLDVEVLNDLMRGSLPALESLELSFGARVAEEGIEGLLDALPPRVTSLGLIQCVSDQALFGLLARHAVTRRLKRLDLSQGMMQDRDVPVLMANASAFEHLELVLSGNLLSEAAIATVRARLPRAIIGAQQEANF